MLPVRSTRVSRYVRAAPAAVYAALVDPVAVAEWKFPSGMTCEVHVFEPRIGGNLRVTLTHDLASEAGKTTQHSDTYSGRFVELVPNERIVEIDEFETTDPTMTGAMTVTISLVPVGDGTEVIGLHEGLPPGVSLADNELGWESALERLAALVESG